MAAVSTSLMSVLIRESVSKLSKPNVSRPKANNNKKQKTQNTKHKQKNKTKTTSSPDGLNNEPVTTTFPFTFNASVPVVLIPTGPEQHIPPEGC